MNIQQAIKAVTERQDLARGEMRAVMQSIMTGEATPAQIGGFLIGLRMKGETIDEITAAAEVMRDLAARVEVNVPHLVDTCGTGGDASGTFNISTAVAFVAAAAGAHVAKHGNRSVSSKCGSADLLEAAGVRLDLDPAQVARCINEIGVGFMFAPNHHSAMKHAIGPRKEMAVRTIFNVLGPLTNPAQVPNQVLGVFSADLTERLAKVLQQLGSAHAMVVHAEDGLDEISIGAPTRVSELKNGVVTTTTIQPEDFGMSRGKLSDIVVSGPAQSLATINAVFDNQPGPARDVVVLNAGAAIYVAGLEKTLAAAIQNAASTIASGAARQKFASFIEFTHNI